MFRHHYHRRRPLKITTELSVIRLIFSISLAAIGTIWALYISSLGFSDSSVGFITALLYVAAFITAFFTTPLLEEYDEVKILLISLSIHAVAYFLIPLFQFKLAFVFLALVVSIAGVFRVDSFDILFRDESKAKELNQNEGLVYSSISLGWLLGPFVAGYFLLRYGIGSVFFASAVFMLISTLILFRLNIKPPKKKRETIDKNILENAKAFLTSDNTIKPFLMSSGIYMWWTMILIYTPLFIVNSGLDKEVISMFIAFIFVPLVILEYNSGKLSELFGFRNFFYMGYFLLSLISLVVFFINDISVTVVLLVFASIAMAFVEPLQDSYFFKKIKKVDEERFYPIYATAEFFGVVVSSVLIALVLLFFPDNYAYLVMGIIMFVMSMIGRTIKY